MLQKLSEHIASCLERAASADTRARDAVDDVMQADNELMASSWRHLAASYQFVESLERFLLDAEREKASHRPEHDDGMLGPGGALEGIAMDVGKYREYALRCIQIANDEVDPVAQSMLFDIARAWTRPADKVVQGRGRDAESR